MPFKRSDIDELFSLRQELKKNGQITAPVDLLLNSLFTIISYQFEQLEGLKEENELLKLEIAKLKSKKKKNSSNSSLPPSQDSNRKRGCHKNPSKKSAGGQPGHKGNTLRKTDKPDAITKHLLRGKCPCGRALSKSRKKGFEERQVFDIEIKRKVTSHQGEIGECKCGIIHKAIFPKDVSNHTQYGPIAKTLATYFCQYQLIPFERTQEIFNDVFNLGLCKATVFNHIKKGATGLLSFKDWAVEDLLKSKLNYADETTTQVQKSRFHLHVVSNNQTTLLDVYKSRGIEAVEAMGVLPTYKGKLVHDCYAMYFGYPCKDVICNAHLERELNYFSQREKFEWAAAMELFLKDLYKSTKALRESGRKKRCSKEYKLIEREFNKILTQARKECREIINKKRIKQEPVVNLFKRMRKHKKGILLFSKDFSVPYTNNQAERDLRMSKVHLKISGCFRSYEMAKTWSLFRSYISTLKKRQINVIRGLKILFDPSIKDPIYSILGHPS